jgi:Tol biopolymer transport system component
MALAPGARLGSYVIVAPLGAGGMGEVYKARDIKLDRDVALKVLPSHLAADPEALARFEREAKAVAALSHPNILAIHDFGSECGTAYAVTELLEGESLRARLADGPLPLKKTLQIATEIAQGLAAAHDRHIVHRDLKPENIFVATDGRVKILDFGLARQIAPLGGDALNAPTELRRTAPGMVMGTVGYMSPEQVRGQAADGRSDIFSFGCVLFEMATGKRPFERETTAETMTAILREDAPEVSRPDGLVPAAIEQVVRHCLEKRPDERYQSARDLAFALRSLSGAGGPSGLSAASTAPALRRPPITALAAAGILLTGAAFVAGRFVAPVGRPPGGPTVVSFQQITDGPGIETNPTISPDGRTVVYAARAAGRSQIFSMHVGARNSVALTLDSSANDSQPAFSPEGERIAIRSVRDGGGIWVMSATGESPRRLTDFGFNPAWSPNGLEVVVSHGDFAWPTEFSALAYGLSAIDVATRQRRVVLGASTAMQPNWSPHGTRIAYFGMRAGGQRDLWTVAADGSEATTGGLAVTDDPAVDWSPTWSPDGTHLYFSSTRGGTMNLWRVPIDEATGRTRGEAEPVTTPSSWSGYYSISRDGTKLAYAGLDWRSALVKRAFDSASETLVGPAVPVLKGTRVIRDHVVSPDGQRIVFTEMGAQEDVLVARIDGTQYTRLTDDAFRNRAPVWSENGKRILFYSDRSGDYQLWTVAPDSTGLTRVQTPQVRAGTAAWARDGRVAFTSLASPGAARGWYILSRAEPGEKAELQQPVDATSFFWPLAWSPDGTRLAGAGQGPSGTDFGVLTLASRQYVKQPRGALWLAMVWLNDGRRLIVRDDRGIWIVHPDTGDWRQLVSVDGFFAGLSVGLTRDDKWITYTETGTEGDIWIATLKK